MDVLPVKANLPSEVKVLMVPKRGELEDPLRIPQR